MANPMQKKSRRSFILGILVAVVLMGVVVAILLMQISKLKEEQDQLIANRVKVYALNKDIKSGQIITQDMLTEIETDKGGVPNNAINNLNDYYLVDQDGNDIITVSQKDENGNERLVTCVVIEGRNYAIENINENTGTITFNGQTRTIIMNSAPVLAKIDMNQKTILTSDSVVKSTETITDSTRLQEYNMIMLSTGLTSGDFIDIRLRMPSGADYLVVSKKQVEVPIIDGAESVNTIWVNLTEDEILTMSNAIVEAYMMEGAVLYTSKYVEPGMQEQATPTYIPSDAVRSLIERDPNIVQEAKNAILTRFNENQTDVRGSINGELSQIEPEDRTTNLNTGVTTEVTNAQQQRQSYLDALAGN